MSNKAVYLEILSFRGYGGIHYYGNLVGHDPYTKIELLYKLSSKQAKAMSDGSFRYRAGQFSARFDTKEELLDVAVRTYKQHFPEAIILLEGNTASANVKTVLDGPEEILEVAKKLVDAENALEWVERYGFYYRKDKADEQKSLSYYFQFRELMKTIGVDI